MRIIFSILLLVLFSCENKKDQEIVVKNDIMNNKRQVNINSQIEAIESLRFRRSYVGHENLSDKEVNKLYTSNPSIETVDGNSQIIKKLNALNLLKNSDLILQKFEHKKLSKEYLDDKNKIEIECKYYSLNPSKIDITVMKDDSNAIKTLDFGGDHIIGIILQDIDDDYIKEILVLTNYYVMNGDNFILTILRYN